MTKKYEWQGHLFSIDDSKGCYLEVTYEDQTGYVGVHLNGTEDAPYCWYPQKHKWVTPNGLTHGNSAGENLGSNIDELCRVLVANYEKDQAQKAFDPERACENLHGFFKNLSG